MISNYRALPTSPNVPALVRELRLTFDERITALYEEATRMLAGTTPAATDMVHVPFTWNDLHVVAIYDRVEDVFTQVIARPPDQVEEQRPAFTISLFLVAMEA